MANLPEFATSTGDHRFDDKLDDRSIVGYEARIAWAGKVQDRVEAWEKSFAGVASKEDRVSARLLRHHCSCVLEGIKFKTFLCPLNRLEGPHTELPQLIDYMNISSEVDYKNYISRLRAIPTSLSQVTDLLREGVATGMLPPAVGLEGVATQLAETEAALAATKVGSDEVSKAGSTSPLWRPCPVPAPHLEAEVCLPPKHMSSHFDPSP